MDNMNGNENLSAIPVTNMIYKCFAITAGRRPLLKAGEPVPLCPHGSTPLYKGSQFSGSKLSWFGRLRWFQGYNFYGRL